MPETAKTWFQHNEFANERLRAPFDATKIPQPESKEYLRHELTMLKSKVENTWNTIIHSSSQGKVKHPGHGYLNAREWFACAEMHLRHDERQLGRLDQIAKGL